MTEGPGVVTSLESCLSRLEGIVDTLERDDLELEEALRLFEEGVASLRSAQKILEETRLRVAHVLRDGSTVPANPVEPAD